MRPLIPRPLRGFSLAELLVSVAIMGTIAALVTPVVSRNMQLAQQKTRLKKAIALVQQLTYQGLSSKEANGYDANSVVDYIVSHANAKIKCPTATVAEGCGSLWNRIPTNADFAAGFVLHDDTEVLLQRGFNGPGRIYVEIFTDRNSEITGPNPQINMHHAPIVTNPDGQVRGGGPPVPVGTYFVVDPVYGCDASQLYR
jgi:prepilin-type N-terminal cleavage/methylation domain-containing protein